MEFISFFIYFIFIQFTDQNIHLISKYIIIFQFQIHQNKLNLLNIDLITKLIVGTPIQKINCNIQSQQFIYYISDENDTRIYNSSNSSSFNNKSSSIIQFMEGPIEKGKISNKTYNFDLISKSNISVEKFNIILCKEHKVGKEIKLC